MWTRIEKRGRLTYELRMDIISGKREWDLKNVMETELTGLEDWLAAVSPSNLQFLTSNKP